MRTEFTQACSEAGITVQEALEAFMVRAEGLGWLDVIARLQNRQTEFDLNEEEIALPKTG